MCAYEHMPSSHLDKEDEKVLYVTSNGWLSSYQKDRWVHILVICDNICVLMSRTVVHNQVQWKTMK